MKKITLLIVFLLSNVIGFSQTTVTIGTGTSASGTSDNGNPIYRSSATSGFSFSQSVQLLTQADLSSVGLSGGSTITKIAYYKTNTSTMGAGRTADLKIYLKNSGSTSLVTTQNMTTWTTGATLCYSNPAVSDTNIPATAGWVEFTFTTPFNYTGGSIEVAIDWTGNGAGSGLTTGAFLWQYTAATAVKAVGTSNSSAITGNLTTSQSRLYNTQLTFSNSPCTGVPAPGNTIASNLTPCAGGTVTFTTQNPTMGSGVTYQWYNSSGTISGATNSTYSQSITSSDSFHCEVTCAGNTTATTPVSVTPLIINSFPWLEEFNTFLPNCWQAADNGDLISGPATFGSSSWVADGFGNNGTTGSIRYEIWLAAANDWIISPLVSIPATGYELKFDAAVTQWNTTAAPTVPWESDDFVEVLVSTSLSNWTVLYTYNDTNVPSPTGDANIINLDAYAGQNVRFAFRVVEGTANGLADLNFYVDNFQIRQTPSCLEPTLLTVNTITANSATLGWTELGTASTWEIEYGPAGFVSGTGTLVPASTNPFVLNGLTSNTSYDFYVRTVCGATQLSYWAGPMAFKTKCNDLTDYVENFDTYTTGTNSLPECWSRGGTSLNTYITNGAVAPMSPSNRLYINASGITPTEAYAILPAVSNLQANTHRLKFKAFSTTANSPLQIGYLTDPTDMNTFIQLEEITLPSTLIQNTQEFTIVPIGIPAGVKHLAIRNSGYPGAVTTAYIDDVKWELIPACPEPSFLTASGITSSSANLAWTEMGSASLWNIEYGITGFTQGTGGTLVSGVTTNPYTLNGLTPATTYQYYVQADCGGTAGASTWTGPFTFTTTCVAVTDFIQDFESTTGTLFPICWSKVGTTGSANTQASTGISGSRNLYMYSTSTSSRPVVSMVPVSNASAGTHRMSMKVRANFTVGETLELGYLTNPSDANSFVSINSIVTNSTTVAQNFITIPTAMPSGDVVFALRTGTSLYSVLIDDVKWEPIPIVAPTCATNIVAVPNASCGNQATVISWNASTGANGYNITIGTTIGGSDVLNNVNIGSVLTYNFVGLSGTTYYYTITPFNNVGPASGCTEQTFTTFATGCACTPVYTTGITDSDLISNVVITGTTLSNNTGTSTTGPYYTYFTGQPNYTATLNQGVTYDLVVTVGTFGSQNVAVWIDFNDDLTFSASERVGFTTTSISANGSATIQIPISCSATPGNHLMRVRDVYATTGANIDPCSSYGYGETEDYNITINATTIPAPTGNAMQTVTESTPANATIEDLVVSPTSVIWYATQADALAGTNALVAGTQLVDNATYYAVNVQNGCPSAPFAVTVAVVLSEEGFNLASFVAYPNPVKDVLNLSYSTEITFVKVINLLGQEVISRKIGSASTQLDMSNLTAGAYIVNVTLNNVTKTIKVIKQ